MHKNKPNIKWVVAVDWLDKLSHGNWLARALKSKTPQSCPLVLNIIIAYLTNTVVTPHHITSLIFQNKKISFGWAL